MRKLLLFSFFLALGLLQQAYAQDRKVSGRVTSATDGSPLPGVNVTLKGTSTGTVTNPDGHYMVEVPTSGGTLVFSFVGVVSQEVAIGTQAVINVAMVDDVKQLNEVVVVGYGSQEKRNITGAVSSIKGDAINNLPVQSFDQALQGRATGVNVNTPNGVLGNAPVIRVRGTNSITASSSPLVVVDGIPVTAGDISNIGFAVNNSLGGVNPADIESIEVLKDASAAAIYGSRAAGGVILITTKKGKQGSSKFTYDTWVGYTEAFKKLPVLNAQQYMDMKNEARRNAKDASGNPLPPAYFPSYNPDGSLVDTDWYSELFRTGVAQNHDLAISGGNDKTVYRFSLGYTNQAGFIRNNDFRRVSARMNLNHKVTDWFNVGSNVTVSSSYNRSPNTASGGGAFNSGGLGRMAVALPTNVAPKLADGSYNINPNNTIGNMANLPTGQSTWWNPIVDLEKNKSTSETNRVLGNAYAEIVPLKNLKLRSTLGFDRIQVEGLDFRNALHGEGYSPKGYAANASTNITSLNWQNTANYYFALGKNNFDVLGGYEVQQIERNQWGAQRSNIADPFFTTYQGNWTEIVPFANVQTQNGLISYIGRINYDFDSKYLVSLNARRDGYSALSRAHKWGNFYGGSLGWRVSKEGFFENASALSFVSDLKFRASIGQVGNTQFSPNPIVANFGSMNLYNSGLYGGQSTFMFSQVGNPDLRWESSTKQDLGFDFGLFKDKISGSFSYYYTYLNDLILELPQSPSKGIPGGTILTNVGSMENKGIELSITSQNINKNGFTWSTTFNVTTNQNKILSLNATNDDIFQATGGLENVSIARVGEPIGSLYAVRTNGVNSANGRRIFINKDGKEVQYDHSETVASKRWTYLDGSPAPAVNASDRVMMGNTNPKWFGGLDNTFTYKNFDLNILLQYSGGNYIYNGTRAGMLDQRNWNNHTDVLNRWTESGQKTEIPRVVWGDNVSNGSAFPLDINIERGDFIRVRNLQLGYSLGNLPFIKAKGFSTLRVYGQIQNAGVLTKYRGFDPENSINGDVNIAAGIDRNSVPQARTYNFGINIGF